MAEDFLKEAVGLLSRTGRNIEIDEYRKARGRRMTGVATARDLRVIFKHR